MSKSPSPVSPFKNNVLKDRVALITGGASGIGLEISRQLGAHGSRLVLMGRRQNVLDAAVEVLKSEGITVIGGQGDVRNLDDAKRVVDLAISTYGRLDILVNSAAGNFLSVAEDLSPKGFKTVMDIDTVGVFTMCHAAFPHLKKSGDASIINISATLHYGATYYQAHASAAKAAIDSLTRSLGLEWAEYGIRVNGIAPGPIADTAGMAKLSGGMDVASMSQTVPIRRFGTKWDIAMCALYLSSSAGNYIAGETIVVDGAAWIWRPPAAPKEAIRSFSRQIEGASRQTGLASDKVAATTTKSKPISSKL